MNKLKQSLLKVKSLRFTSETLEKTGWSGSGNGIVNVKSHGEIIRYDESGSWLNSNSKTFGFKNTYRWTFEENHVKLEHLRFGEKDPVFLFNLIPKNEYFWTSECPHKCKLDDYNAQLEIKEDQILLNWSVVGPEKNERINYWYIF